MNVTRPRGTNDILPEQALKWQYVEQVIARVCRSYGYGEIRTPIFEHTELFSRGIGEATDIVEKEMYTFLDRKQRSFTLRPEGTAAVVRAFLENKLYANSLPAKLYYAGPMFRYERPQAGRYRQFSQFGVEAIGSEDAALDVEMIAVPLEVYHSCGLEGFMVELNSIGCLACRKGYKQELSVFLKERQNDLCRSCQDRLERNPMRVLDCKVESCRQATDAAPRILDHLCSDCAEHFAQVQEYLQALDIAYQLNPRLVRGFDYYTRTVFEITVASLGAQNAVGGGGRYDRLVEECGGPQQPAVGFAVGLDRLILALEQQKKLEDIQSHVDGFIAQFGGESKKLAVTLAHSLRSVGLSIALDYQGRGLKAQMKRADKLQAGWVMIIGEDELTQGVVNLRWMNTGQEGTIPLETAVEYIAQKEEQLCNGNGQQSVLK